MAVNKTTLTITGPEQQAVPGGREGDVVSRAHNLGLLIIVSVSATTSW